jgi:hypothetical protein
MEKSVELLVYQSDFIAKCMSDEGFLARRGVLEVAAQGRIQDFQKGGS